MGITVIILFQTYPVHLLNCILQFGLQESNLSLTFKVQINKERQEMHSILGPLIGNDKEKHKPKKRGNY